jgi:predicted nucleic acid-binding Zn ribbon protein
VTGPRRRDDGPRPLDGSLDALSSKLGMAESRGLAKLFARWDEIVGPAIASHVKPVRLDKNSLVVTVDHPAWATQVRHLGDDLLDRVADVTELPRPASLEVKVRR